ncbi:MAG: hypothetical protein RLO38_21270, partial [Roseovarius confluentis]
AEFGGEIILDDVPGAVSVMSMENFLLKQGNIRLRQSSAIGFSLQQADRYFQKMDPTYYAVLIGDMAQAVSRALSAFPHMLTCPGNGDIVALLVDRAHVDIDQIKENLAHELEALRLRFSAIDMTLPQLETGAPVRTGLFRTHCPTTLIARARAAARGSEGTRAAHNLQAIA